MKIRPDFVTNSSSESYGEVVIDNPVLLEILAKYKALGTFGENAGFDIGDFQTYTDIETLTPAFNSLNAHQFNTPHSLDEVLINIIKVMADNNNGFSGEYFDLDLFQEMVEELQGRADEINRAFIAVKWFSREDLNDGRPLCWEFKYDQEHGEDYYEEESGY